VYYFIGSYQNFTFTPEQQGVLDASTHFYAPQSFRDEQGRRILFGWLREGRDDAALQAAGWAGVMSLPRILSLRDGALWMEPAAELTSLRQRHHEVAPQLIEGPHLISEHFSSNALEMLLEIEYNGHCGVRIEDKSYPDERLQINLQTAGVSVEQTAGDHQSTEQCALEPGRHTLHIFIDGSVMEIFIDSRQCITERFYHSTPQQLGLSLFFDKGETRLHQLDVWELQV
jgi:beta-fructofuranosidase